MKDFGVIFPGQGSQSLGMLAELGQAHPIVLDVFAEASEALGFDLWALCQQGPESELNQTQNTQPAMLAAGIAVWRLWQQHNGPAPKLLAGHSLGEYSALVAAGSLSFADGIRLVAERGRLMQQAVPEGVGAMAAILGLEDDQVRAACAAAAQDQVCEAVNFNAPGQVVAAGNKEAIERLLPLAKQAGAKRALPLAVSVPSHCALMRPAAEALQAVLAEVEIKPPSIPVIHNVSVASEADPAAIRQLLAEQLYRPVRWVETARLMQAQGLNPLLEMGPGKVLTGLVKRIDKQLTGLAVLDDASLAAALEEVSHAG
ncbi:ACP S-malonyltransferase [Magnetovirga frankeli]|uniref:ACP S-malonyltransferase n=1 Tax=Magnetovirga frankeli TaxID=947516 RepID=UPI001293FC7C|nr:ACP S-malonyltransferase [gamma proteobacterium SS-5]